MNTKDTNPKDAIGSKKPPLSTVPVPVLFELGAAMLEGTKYRRHNYRIAGIRVSVYYDAAMRHIMSWWEGQDLDPDSGIHHLAKAMACLAILRDGQMQGIVQDDRPPTVHPDWQKKIQATVSGVIERLGDRALPPYTIADSPKEGS